MNFKKLLARAFFLAPLLPYIFPTKPCAGPLFRHYRTSFPFDNPFDKNLQLNRKGKACF